MTKKHHWAIRWCFLYSLEGTMDGRFSEIKNFLFRVEQGFLDRKMADGTVAAKGGSEAVHVPQGPV